MSPQPTRKELAAAQAAPEAQEKAQYIVLILDKDTTTNGYGVTPQTLRIPPGAQMQWHCNLPEPCSIVLGTTPFFPLQVSAQSSSPVLTVSADAPIGSKYSYTVVFSDGTRHDPEIIIDNPPVPRPTK